MIKFSVVIVSWQVKDKLEQCLLSLGRELGDQFNFKVTLVDNASVDGTVEMVRQKFPWVNLIAVKDNLGFAKACNLGSKNQEADYLLFLNPDTQITSGFFSDLERSFIHHPQAAVIGGHIINPDGSTQPSVRNFPNLWISILEVTKLLSRFPWLASGYLLSKFNYNETQEVEQVMGACFAVRTKVWRELNGFDEHFFLWFEEVDFCKRAKQAGYQIWYDHNINLIHNRGCSFYQLSYHIRHYYFTQSLVYYVYKHKGLAPAIFIWLLSRPWLIFSMIYDRIIRKK